MTPEMLSALLPWGGGAFAVVMAFLFTKEILKTYRTRLVTKGKDEDPKV